MAQPRTDILKQPIPMLLATFVALLAALVVRSLGDSVASAGGVVALSSVGEWVDGRLGSTMSYVVGVLCVALSSVIITRITSRYSLSVIRSFVPMVLYVVCACGVVYPMGSPSVGLALLMIVHAVELMILSFRRTEQFGSVMRAAFWSGMAAILVPDLVYVVALLPLHWVVWQRSVREMVAATIMLLLPMLYGSVGYWFGGESFGWFAQSWVEALRGWHFVDWGVLYESLGSLLGAVLFGAITLLTLVSMAVFALGYGTMRIRARKGHVVFSATYLMGLFMLIVVGLPAELALPVMGIGAAPLIYTFFVKHKGALSTIIYVAVVLLSIVVSFLS